MPDLYPTKTRLELLRAVKADDVWTTEAFTGEIWMDLYDEDGPTGASRMVTARYAEASAAGWLKLGPQRAAVSSVRLVELTDAGRKVLEEAGRA